jgi:D-alanyl-D-alanine carboxypeptidase
LEALTVVSGPRIQGGVQLSNFPIQIVDKGPFARHSFEEQLQKALDQVVSSYGIRGSSVAVKMPGQPIWTGVSGNSTPTEPIRPQTLFGIASITKPFIAALTLALADQGLLDLHDPLSRWLPEFPNVDSRITVRQLLNHTSGVYNYEFNSALVGSVFGNPHKSWTPEELLSFVRAPSFPPGTGWEYSNTNYLLLGMIVRKAANSEVSAELRRRSLAPLGLSDTFLLSEEPASRELAHSWSDYDQDGQFQDISAIKTSLFSAAWTAGGLVSTAEDVVTWTESLFEGRILSENQLRKMLDFHPVDPAASGITGYGLGIQKVELNGHVFWGHGGNMPGWNSLMLYEPRLRLSIAILFNQDGVGYQPSVALIEALCSAIRPGLPDNG